MNGIKILQSCEIFGSKHYAKMNTNYTNGEINCFFCWLSHLKMSFYYLTSHKERREVVVYFSNITL